MAQQIEWTPQALQDFGNIILYLEERWGATMADDFTIKTEKKLLVLAQQPLIGIASERVPSIRSISLSKQNRLYYRVEEQKLIVLNIFDTKQDPAKNRF